MATQQAKEDRATVVRPGRIVNPTLNCGPGRTRQEFKEETDVNYILNRFNKTGMLTHTNNRLPQYGDFSEVADYATAHAAVTDANEAFNELPAHIRKRFGNSPQRLLEFLEDPANLDEAEKLGLVTIARGTETQKSTEKSGQEDEKTESGTETEPVTKTS